MPRFNRVLVIEFHYLEKGIRVEKAIDKLEFNSADVPGMIPPSVDITIIKDISSMSDTASIQVQNHPALEELMRFPQNIQNLQDHHIEVAIHMGDTGSGEITEIYTGDLLNVSIAANQDITDQALVFKCASFSRAQAKGWMNHRFPTGTSYEEMVRYVFEEVYARYGIALRVYDDIEGILQKKTRRPRTFHRRAGLMLEDLSRGVDQPNNRRHFGYYWGVGPYSGGSRPGYWVDRRGVFDIRETGAKMPFELSAETGRMGRIGLDYGGFSFFHAPDVMLSPGVGVVTNDYPTTSNQPAFHGRIDTMQYTLSNTGANHVRCACSFTNALGQVQLRADRRDVTSKVIL